MKLKLKRHINNEGFTAFIDDYMTYVVTLNHPLFMEFAMAGFAAKLRQQAAVAKEKGESEVEMVQVLVAQFNEGKWNLQRNRAASPKGSLTAQAIASLKGKSIAEAEAYLQGLGTTPVERRVAQAKLRQRPDVAAEIIRLKASATSAEAGLPPLQF